MEFTNDSLERVTEARKVVNEFTEEVLKRAKLWLEDNFMLDWGLPAPHIIFAQQGWIVEVSDVDKVLNDTTFAPVQIRFRHPDIQPPIKTFVVPAAFIFTEAAKV